MLIRLKGKKNIYEEIVDDYTRYILSGALAEGEKLPSCRALATQLGINPNTVERAYAELERQGLIRTLPKKGAYVAYAGGGREALFEEANHSIAALKGAGLTKEELFALAEKIYGKTEEINDRDQSTRRFTISTRACSPNTNGGSPSNGMCRYATFPREIFRAAGERDGDEQLPLHLKSRSAQRTF